MIHPPRKFTPLFLFVLLLIISVSGCRASDQTGSENERSIPTIVVEVLTAVAPTPPPATLITPDPTVTADIPTPTTPAESTAPPSPSPEIAVSPTPLPPRPQGMVPNDLALDPNKFFVYPTGEIFAGDQVTVQFVVHVPDNLNSEEVEVLISLNGQPISRGAGFQTRNLGGEIVGLYPWLWDTTNAPGQYSLSVALDPDDQISVGDENPVNNTAEQVVTVLPVTAMDNRQAAADWVSVESEMATIHVVSGTAAERDLPQLAVLTDQAIHTAATRLQEQPVRKYDVFFIDRVIGQGGYATGSMVVSYLDRNYAGGGLQEVLTHEAIHLLDQQFIRGGRPQFLAEGIAVWATGGHYKPENLNARMRALRDTGLAYGLRDLIDNFYPVQHEIGYLEAGAFFSFLVDQFGWEQVKEFYATIPTDAQRPSDAIDQALQATFGQSLSQLETAWIGTLNQFPADSGQITDLNNTIRFYNVMRDYQLAFDPTAHFEQAWLPSPRQLLERDSTAELSRKPAAATNIALEILLTEADHALRSGQYQQAELLLNTVERVLRNNGQFRDPLAQAYYDIVTTSLTWGFEPHRIAIEGNVATVQVSNPFSADLFPVQFYQDGPIWVLIQETD